MRTTAKTDETALRTLRALENLDVYKDLVLFGRLKSEESVGITHCLAMMLLAIHKRERVIKADTVTSNQHLDNLLQILLDFLKCVDRRESFPPKLCVLLDSFEESIRVHKKQLLDISFCENMCVSKAEYRNIVMSDCVQYIMTFFMGVDLYEYGSSAKFPVTGIPWERTKNP